jgi:hypothetical protein
VYEKEEKLKQKDDTTKDDKLKGNDKNNIIMNRIQIIDSSNNSTVIE